MYEKLFSERALTLEPSLTLEISARATQLAKDGRDICNLSAGEPDFLTPDEILKETSKAMFNGYTKYGPASGDIELRKAITNKLNSENNLDIDFKNILVTNGAKQAIFNLFQILLNKEDEVIIPSPYWLSYPQMVRLAGGRPVFIESLAEDGFKLDIDKLVEKITHKTKFIIINSPNNPTGRVMNKEELLKIVSILREHKNLHILSDEIYELILQKGIKHLSIASLAHDLKDRIYTVNGFAKGWAMTGWRVGYLVGNEKVIKKAAALQSQSTSNVCSFVQRGAIEALNCDNNFFMNMNEKYDKRRQVLCEGLSKINGVFIKPPCGAFYAFPRLPRTNKNYSSIEFCKNLLDDFGLVLVPGKAFGNDECVRISFASSLDKINDGLNRFHKAIKTYY